MNIGGRICTQVNIIVATTYFVGNKAKGRISKPLFQENKAHQVFQKTNISYPLIRTHVYVSGGKKCSFFGKFGVLFFLLETPVLKFALLRYYQRFGMQYQLKKNIFKNIKFREQGNQCYFMRTAFHKLLWYIPLISKYIMPATCNTWKVYILKLGN